MIYIEESEKVALPKKYHKINNLCAIIYDQIAEVFTDISYQSLKKSSFNIKNGEQKFVKELQNNEIHALEWLRTNNLNTELNEVLGKQISMSILHDFVNFTYESLHCAKRGKMSVAYALLRKPFTDELLILEQLLYDQNNFIQKFYHLGEPKSYDPSKTKLDEKKKIISNAVSIIKPAFFFNEEFIYELRYEKSNKNGINGLSNQAHHIVTTDPNYKTENQSLNFVFLSKESLNENWNHYYFFVPYILIYSAMVIDEIIFKYIKIPYKDDLKATKLLRRIIGLILLTEWTNLNSKKSNKPMFNMLSSSLNFICKNCNLKFTKADFELFFDLEIFLCPSCLKDTAKEPENLYCIKKLINQLT